MALDNSLYDSLENTFFEIKNYLESIQLGREHSPVMLKHEELGELLETFDVETLEEQTKDINSLHDQLNTIKEISNKILEDIKKEDDSETKASNVFNGLEKVFDKINKIVL